MRGIIRQERIEKRKIYKIEGLPEGGRRVLSGMLAEGGRRRAVRDVGRRWSQEGCQGCWQKVLGGVSVRDVVGRW